MKLINNYQKKFQIFLLSLLLVISFLFLNNCSTNPVSGKKNFVLVSEKQEITIGKNAHSKISQHYPAYANETLQNYVNQIGQLLATRSHRNNLKYTFTVVNSPEINAFALPGGYVYVTYGLMAYLSTESELAAVLGHEIGHITARHGIRQQSLGIITDLATSALPRKSTREKIVKTLNTLLTSGYGRSQELEADRLGAEYLSKANYPSDSMIRVVEILKAQENYIQAKTGLKNNSIYHNLFSTHPNHNKRLQKATLAAKHFTSTYKKSPDHGRYLRRIVGIPFNFNGKRLGRIALKRVKAKETFLSVAKNNGQYADLLRLLNGMYPKGEPKNGQLIKLVNQG